MQRNSAENTTFINGFPDHLKTQEMCDEAVRNIPWALKFVPDRFKTEEMCIKTLEVYLWLLKYVPDHLKTRKMWQCSGILPLFFGVCSLLVCNTTATKIMA